MIYLDRQICHDVPLAFIILLTNGLQQEYDIAVSLNFTLCYFGTDNYFIGVIIRVLLKMRANLKKPSDSMFSRGKVIFIVEMSLVITT
jgi:hypothetical protein